jgi:hypothetical protein
MQRGRDKIPPVICIKEEGFPRYFLLIFSTIRVWGIKFYPRHLYRP